MCAVKAFKPRGKTQVEVVGVENPRRGASGLDENTKLLEVQRAAVKTLFAKKFSAIILASPEEHLSTTCRYS
jgi:hypothetical protein